MGPEKGAVKSATLYVMVNTRTRMPAGEKTSREQMKRQRCLRPSAKFKYGMNKFVPAAINEQILSTAAAANRLAQRNKSDLTALW